MSRLLEISKFSLAGLMRHRLRTALSSIGLMFGVASIVAIVLLSEGAKREAMSQVEALGASNIIVSAKDMSGSRSLSYRAKSLGLDRNDARALLYSIRSLEKVGELKRLQQVTVASVHGSVSPEVLAVSSSVIDILGLELAKGRVFDTKESLSGAQVALVGTKVAEQLIDAKGTFKRPIKIGHLWFRVIGVVRNTAKDSEISRVSLRGPQNSVYIPLATGLNFYTQKALEPEIDELLLKLTDVSNVSAGANAVEQILLDRHNQIDDFSITVPSKLMEQKEKTQRLFNTILAVVATLALLTGGIGIMNSMLASIFERRSEIGLLQALGADRRLIQEVFLLESIMISAFGSIMGAFLGIAFAYLVSHFTDWPIAVSGWLPFLVSCVMLFTGITFGTYPAMQAARLDPIVALKGTEGR